ncbi:alpha/beta-hydrolase [Xylaria arbuscula]|nr:alpha/beta-hydrolase [Xylaria arbuscula]
MSSTGLPTIVLVPGAFGKLDGFDLIIPYLTEAGFMMLYGSVTRSEYETVGLGDVYGQQKRGVIALAHSYGGMVAGGAVKDLVKATRRTEGYAAGIVELIYIIGNIAIKGETLKHAVGGTYPHYVKKDKPYKGVALIEPAMDVLYSDCDPAREPELARHMNPLAYLAFDTPATAPGWADKGYTGKRAYIRALKDRCNPKPLQDI